MHPQDSDRFVLCKDFFLALDTCHASAWLKWTGGCNEAKDQLNVCLRQIRLDKAAQNRADAKIRQEKTAEARRELHSDD